MNQNNAEDHMALVSHLYPGVYTQIIPEQGDEAPQAQQRRRRKKSKVEGGNGGLRKRKLSAEQAKMLEINFGNEHKLESERKDRLASELGLDPRQVAVWFQNRRARWKNKKLEEEYSLLKNLHENIVVEKYRLESEVLKLKDQLLEAEREIQRLAERRGGWSNSPTSSVTMETVDPPFLGDYEVEHQYEDLFYLPENCYVDGMDWMGLYM